MGRILDRQMRFNESTRNAWEACEPHRAEIMSQTTRNADPLRDRLCVFGAGNCNDIDLERLCDSFREIHLVDLDEAALSTGIQRQATKAREGLIFPHGGVDVSGLISQLDELSSSADVGDQAVDALLQQCASHQAPLDVSEFDLVISTCLVSQLIYDVIGAVGEKHARLAELTVAVREAHVRLMLDVMKPGGIGILFFDVVSSDTASELPSVTDEELPNYVAKRVAAGDFFTGMNPAVMLDMFKCARGIAEQVTGYQLIRPWKWRLGSRWYAVAALKFRRHGE